jgi:hypothetical protein
MSIATLDNLVEQFRQLPDERQQVLMGELESGAMAEEMEKPRRDVPGQLPLFGFKQLVETDDALNVVTLSDIASTYGISVMSLLRYIRDGKLTARQFGRKYIITIKELKRFLAEPQRSVRRGINSKGRPRKNATPAAAAGSSTPAPVEPSGTQAKLATQASKQATPAGSSTKPAPGKHADGKTTKGGSDAKASKKGKGKK